MIYNQSFIAYMGYVENGLGLLNQSLTIVLAESIENDSALSER